MNVYIGDIWLNRKHHWKKIFLPLSFSHKQNRYIRSKQHQPAGDMTTKLQIEKLLALYIRAFTRKIYSSPTEVKILKDTARLFDENFYPT